MRTDYAKNTVIIVSAYSSGAKLASLFNEKDYQCIHITTGREWDIVRLRSYFRENDFIKNIIVEDNNQEELITTINYLKKFQVKLIVPGCESGVTLADFFSQFFDVPKNDYALTSARRNKYFMIEALEKNGLKHPAQYKSDDIKNTLNWFSRSSFSKVVLKPLSSSSSDSVFYCQNENEIKEAFHTILGAKDMYDEINREVLIQEFVEGDEYIVNTVSRNGLHSVIDIWKGVSHNKNIVSNDSYADLIHPQMPEYKLLTDYVTKALTALGICNGAAHSEVKITKNSPCLIETGARLAGKVDFATIEKIFGVSQLSLTVNGLIDFTSFKNYTDTKILPKKHARYVYFASDREGLINRDPDLEEILNIKSLAFMNFSPKKGNQLRVTSKTFRSPRPGYAYLVADSQQKLEEDYVSLRQAEKRLYADMLGVGFI